MEINDLTKLTYGSIIKLKLPENEQPYNSEHITENRFYFVNYIGKKDNEQFYISLISFFNSDEKDVPKTIDIDFEENGTPVNKNIFEKIIVYHLETKSYAELHNLVPSNNVLITFKNKERVKGEILSLVEDKIQIKLHSESANDSNIMNIDFHYGGIDKDYEIESIQAIKKPKVKSNKYFLPLNNSNIDKIKESSNDIKNQEEEKEDFEENGYDEEEEEYLFYNLEQQVDDYLNHNIRKDNKNIIQKHIDRYSQLFNIYTDLEKGIKIKSFSNYSFKNNINTINYNFIIPTTSYAYKQIYNDKNKSDSNLESIFLLENDFKDLQNNPYGVYVDNVDDILTELNDIDESTNNKDKLNNVLLYNQKRNQYHKKFRFNGYTRFNLISPECNIDENIFYSINKGTFKQNILNFDNINVSKLYLNGFLFQRQDKLKQNFNFFDTNNILTKTIQTCNFTYDFSPNNLTTFINDKSYDYYQPIEELIFKKNYMYYPFNNDYNRYLSEFYGIDIYYIYNNLLSRHHTSYYEIMKELKFYGVNDINDNSFILRMLRENIKTILNEIKQINNQLKKIKIEKYNYKNIDDNLIYNILHNKYKINNANTLQKSEIFNLGIEHDNHNYLIQTLIEKNDDLIIQFDDEEIVEIITTFNEELSQIANKDNKFFETSFVKKYINYNSMIQDNNTIVLKDLEFLPTNINTFDASSTKEYLYKYLSKNKSVLYTEDPDTFYNKLNLILKSGMDFEQHENIFNGNIELFKILINEILRLKMEPGEKCIVNDTKKKYVFNGHIWIDEKDYNNKYNKKKIFKVKNSINNIDEVRNTILQDYLFELLNQFESDKIKQNEIKQFNLKYYTEDKMNKQIILKKNNIIRNILKYNSQKEKLQNVFLRSDYLTNLYENSSIFTPLLYKIINIDDLDVKSLYIQKFVKYFTVDLNDPDWYFCIFKKTKLIPKFLHRLSVAHLTYDNYDSLLDEICLKEGTVSDNGDAWIHKISGFYLKNINFDDNYGYDENGFKIKNDSVDTSVDIADFLMENDDVYDAFDAHAFDTIDEEEELEKNLILMNIKRRIEQLTISFNQILGISLVNIERKDTIYMEIYRINEYAMKTTNIKQIELSIMYAIMGFMLCYIQTNVVYIKKTFPGCNADFSGFPTEPLNGENGLEYLCCVIHKISQRNPNKPYLFFKRKNLEEIKEEFKTYIEECVLVNSHVYQMIQNKINQKQQSLKNYNELILKPPVLFKPSLYKLSIEDDVNIHSLLSKSQMNFTIINKLKDNMDLLHLKIQEFIQNTIKKEKPLLETQYNEPFLLNYCCNNKELLLSYIKTKQEKDEFSNLLESSNDIYMFIKNQFYTFCMPKQLSIVKTEIESIKQIQHMNFNDSVVYKFFIKLFNFDNKNPIPSHLTKYNINKPDYSIYNKNETEIQNKIIQLNELNYNKIFSEELMLNILKETSTEVDFLKEIKYNKQLDTEIDFLNDYLSLFSETDYNDKNKLYNILEDNINKEINSYESFLTTNLSNTLKEFYNIKNIFDKFKLLYTDENKITLINKLKNINYQLIYAIPSLLLHNKIIKTNRKQIIFKNWGLADKHISNLVLGHRNYYLSLNHIIRKENIENYFNIFMIIQKYKLVYNYDKFNYNINLQFLYHKLLFYKILNIYAISDDSISDISPKMLSLRNVVNSSIISTLSFIIKKQHYTYESLSKLSYNSKQAEKKIKTDKLKSMNKSQRDVEKVKMMHKMGDWAYGNDKRVFKYYRKYFEDEENIAKNIQKVNNELFGNEVQISVFNEQYNGDDENQNIFNEEQDNIAMLTGEDDMMLDAAGEEIDSDL